MTCLAVNGENGYKKILGLLEWGVLHYVPQLHNMANEFLLRRVLPSYRKKAGSASRRSRPHSPFPRFLSHQWANKRAFALSPETDWKRKVPRSHAAFSCLLWSGCMCMCVLAITCNIARAPSSLSLWLHLCISPLHTRAHTNTTVDSGGMGSSCSFQLYRLALACLLPFPFCSPACSPSPVKVLKVRKELSRSGASSFLLCFDANVQFPLMAPILALRSDCDNNSPNTLLNMLFFSYN